MKIDATKETTRAVADALELASLLDDRAPHPSPSRIAAWAEQIQRHNLTRDDLLDAVQMFYDQPHERAIGVSDLVHLGRSIKRDRLDRQPPQPIQPHLDNDTTGTDSAALIDTATLEIGSLRHTERPNTTPRLDSARQALQTCHGATQSREAIREYLTALRDARRNTKTPHVEATTTDER